MALNLTTSPPTPAYAPTTAAAALEPIALTGLEPITQQAIQQAIAQPHLWQRIAESIAAGAPIATCPSEWCSSTLAEPTSRAPSIAL